MKTLFLIRHGKASLEGSDRERGLTDEGIEQANQITEILGKIDIFGHFCKILKII